MAKKDKSNSSTRSQANAPELQQILSYQQPAHNPYYPDPALAHTPSVSIPPPPYTPTPATISQSAASNSVPMSQLNDIRYPRIQSGASPPIVIQGSGVPYNQRAEWYRHKVRSFNAQTIVIAVLSIILAMWAHSLYSHRDCIPQFVVHKINKDMEIKISDIRNQHVNLAYAGGLLILLCLLKSAIGYDGKSHSCYLFIIGLYSFVICVHNAYLTYLVFYSPCVISSENLFSGSVKTIWSKLSDSLPNPDKGVFGESNVIAMAKQDGNGLAIFIMDMMNTIFYFSIFLSSAILC